MKVVFCEKIPVSDLQVNISQWKPWNYNQNVKTNSWTDTIFWNYRSYGPTYSKNLSNPKILLHLSQLCKPLLGRSRSRGRCWTAIRLCHRPEGHVVHVEVDGLDIEGQHGRRFVLLCHTHRPQRRPYPICTNRSETSDIGAEAVKPDPGSSLECHSGG